MAMSMLLYFDIKGIENLYYMLAFGCRESRSFFNVHLVCSSSRLTDML